MAKGYPVVKLTMQYGEAMARFQRRLEDYADAVKKLDKDAAEDAANVVLEQTLAYHIFDLLRRDQLEASQEFEKRRREVKDAVERTDFMANNSIEDYDRSCRYRQLINLYIENEGNFPRRERDEFADERTNLVARVLAEMDITLTTCVNSGGDWITESFHPTVIVIDEAGQATIPAACVPLTAFTDHMGVLLIGDIKQLHPTVLSHGFNVVIENARLSPMALLMAKDFSVFKLTNQHRSDPEITAFPAKQFYKPGEYVDHPITKLDNATKRKVRTVSKDHYGIKKEQGGNVYWFVDVVYGQARVEPTGTSQQNHANAAAIAKAVKHLLDAGVEAQCISVLTV